MIKRDNDYNILDGIQYKIRMITSFIFIFLLAGTTQSSASVSFNRLGKHIERNTQKSISRYIVDDLIYTYAVDIDGVGEFSPEYIKQEQKLVKGIVLDSKTKKGIIGVSIFVEESYGGTITDSDGMFVYKAEIGDVLIVSRIGYKTLRKKITKYDITIYLEEQVEFLDEVKVVAKANINDIDIRKKAGTIEVVNMQPLATRPELDLSMMLQGQVPGLKVSTTGDLGSKPKVRIRGVASFRKGDSANEPLYILDGMLISSEAFMTINPEDIEEVKVLKDAAASALYGIKAANGVIEISSKRGYEGKTQIIYRNKTGITFRGQRGVDLMNSKEKLELERLMKNQSMPGYLYSEDYYRKYHVNDPNLDKYIQTGKKKLDSLRGINTDWFKELIKINTYQSHSLGIRGGTSRNQYYYSVNYSKQGGRIEGNSVERMTGRMNLDYNILPTLQASLNMTAGFSNTNTPNGSIFSPTQMVYNLNPYEQKVDSKTGESKELYSYTNRRFIDLMNQYSKEITSKRFGTSINARWDILDGLSLSSIVGLDYLLTESLARTPSTAYSQRNYPEEEKGKISKDKNTDFNYSSNIRINYNKVIGKHDITVGANSDYYLSANDNLGMTGYGIARNITAASGINQGLEGLKKPRTRSMNERNAQIGFGVAAGYTFDDMYDLYASYKADASSLLPKDKRWNSAWAVGGGWKIGSYSFFENAKILTGMRVNASYGQTASIAGIPAASSVATYSYTQNIYAHRRVFDLKQYYNINLRPEQTKTTNIGINMCFFNRVNLGVSIYKRRTEDALISVPIPVSNGYSNLNRNVGILENSGIELKLDYVVLDGESIRWNTSFSLSYNKNEVVDLYDGDELFLTDGLFPDMKVGEPIGVIYGLHSLGIHSIDGLPRYLSTSGKEITYKDKLSKDDFYNLGFSTPPYNGFINNYITYKNFDLSFDIYFSFGGKEKYPRTYVRDYDHVNYNAVKGQTQDMWFKIGDENKLYHTAIVPSLAYDMLRWPTTKTVHRTDFARLNNIRLTYKLPREILNKLGDFIEYANFNVQAQNIYTLRASKDKASLNGVQQPILTLGASITF